MSNTTPASRARLRARIVEQVQHVQKLAGADPLFCLGDLFDTDTNSEADILAGYMLAQNCTGVLAGNHDLPNREGKLSSLQLLKEMIPQDCNSGKIHSNDATHEAQVFIEDTDEALLVFVPHTATQQQFERALQLARDTAMDNDGARILCLHCNFDNGFAEGHDISLNLTRQRAQELLTDFDYILLGHEHMPRMEMDERVIVLGNTLPLNFGEIHERYVWELDQGTFRLHTIWDDKAAAIDVNYADLDAVDWSEVEYVNVTGDAAGADMPKITKAIHGLWAKAPKALMIRNAVKSLDSLAEVDGHAIAKLEDVPTRIRRALEGTDMIELWDHYVGSV